MTRMIIANAAIVLALTATQAVAENPVLDSQARTQQALALSKGITPTNTPVIAATTQSGPSQFLPQSSNSYERALQRIKRVQPTPSGGD